MSIKNYFTPVRCRLCFDKLNTFADVVLGDPHDVTGIDRLHGETLVLVRTEDGEKLVAGASDHGAVELREADIEEAVKGQKIAKKRIEWAGYMKAWSDMGRPLPQYPFALVPPYGTNMQRRWLLHGLKLDQFMSRCEVIQKANSWLLREKILKVGLLPFSIAKRLLKRIKQRELK